MNAELAHQSGFSDIYANISLEENLAFFSGISFSDLIEFIPIPVENILLLKSDYITEKSWRGFDILEGRDDISGLLRDNIHRFGDFACLDYNDIDAIKQLKNEQIAELLYLAHIHEPLISPHFEVLQNRFVYLSHDNGWYSKLFFKELQIPRTILINKIKKTIQHVIRNDEYSLPNDLIEVVEDLSMKGLLITIDLSMQRRKIYTVKLYEVGKHQNPDALFNSVEYNKLPVSFEMKL